MTSIVRQGASPPPWGLSRQTRRSLLTGLAFTSPWLIGFLVFFVYPIAASLYLSFTNYNIIAAPRFVGLSNYVRLFTDDSLYWIALYNTLYWVLFAVPGSILVGFILAVLLNRGLFGRPLLRTVFFLPSVVPQVASAI